MRLPLTFRDLFTLAMLRKNQNRLFSCLLCVGDTGKSDRKNDQSPHRVHRTRGKKLKMSNLLMSRRSAAWTPVLVGLLVLCSVAAFGQFAASTSTVNFGNVQVGSMSSVPIPVSNTSRSNLTITQVTVSGNQFSFAGPNLPITLAPQQSANVYVTFFPQTAGSASGSMAITDLGVNGRGQKQHVGSSTISLSGTGVSGGYLTPSPASLNFGNIPVGSIQTQSVTVTNSGGSSVGISQASVSGNVFTLSGFSPQTLAVGQSMSFGIGFKPNSGGTVNGTLNLTSTAADSNLSVALSGAGASPGQLTASPVSVSFGSVSVGGSSNQSGTLTATGASVTVTSASSSNSQFTIGKVGLPLTIASGQSVPFTVTFSPLVSGTVSGSLSFVSNASVSTVSETVSGTGQAAQHNVSLSWSPSTSTITGYNVYRGTTSGGPYARINPSIDSVTAFADSTVQSGQTYYYVTTAVASGGMESKYSNETSAQVP